mgnify:CR=1 FL=1
MDVNSMAILILLGSFFLMIMLRFPIAYAVALSSVFCLMAQGLPLTTICQQMVKGISSFSLMAVPFFITMGCLMGSGGISEKLIALANACVGWMRGGMAMVNIVASYFFGGISGSASADTASLGSILIPMMVDQGYDGDFSTAVTITSSCEGLFSTSKPQHGYLRYHSRRYFRRKPVLSRIYSGRSVSCFPDDRLLHYFCKAQLSKGRQVQHEGAVKAVQRFLLGSGSRSDRCSRRSRRCVHSY